MADLQCPARFVLVSAAHHDLSVDVRLSEASPDPLSALEDLADLHRGETLVVQVAPAVDRLLPALLRPPADGSLTVEVDADGWRRVLE